MTMPLNLYETALVALLAEGVDRNLKNIATKANGAGSPSSRRAWIEIRMGGHRDSGNCVALLAEGVDRNRYQS